MTRALQTLLIIAVATGCAALASCASTGARPTITGAGIDLTEGGSPIAGSHVNIHLIR